MEQLLLDRYRLQQRRARGGFGVVDIAWDQRLRRRVAIKRIPLQAEDRRQPRIDEIHKLPRIDEIHKLSGIDEIHKLPRIDEIHKLPGIDEIHELPGIEEARTAALLSDEHIVSVYDFELTATEALIIMENVDGPSLAELMKASSELLDLDTVCALISSVVAALECAHENQVLHLDIKPGNVLISHTGHVKVTDFGLATLSSTAGFNEPQGGSIGYMPPEQIEMESVDERSDLWALAALTYQLLTGDNPFFAHTAESSLQKILDEPIVLPSIVRPELDEDIDDVLITALDADKNNRPSSVTAFWKKLAPFLGREKVGRQHLKALVGQWAAEEELNAIDNETRPRRSLKEFPPPIGPSSIYTRRTRQKDRYSDGAGAYLDSSPRRRMDDTEEPAKPPPWQQLSPRIRGVLIRLLAALGCASMCWLGCSGFASIGASIELNVSVRIIITLVVAACGFFAPSLGVALASIALGVGTIVAGQPVAGALILTGLIAWWVLCGRRSQLDATIMSLAPLTAALGIPFVIALLTGYFLRLKRACGLALTSSLMLILLSALSPPSPLVLGSGSFLTSDLLRCGFELQTSQFGGDLFAVLVTAFARPDVLLALAGCLVSALVLSLICGRQSRVSWSLGVFVAGIVLALAVLILPIMAGPATESILLAQLITSVIVSCVLVFVMIGIGIEAQPEDRGFEDAD